MIGETHRLVIDHAYTIRYDGHVVDVSVTEDTVRIGCTVISVKALNYLLKQHEKHFGLKPSVVAIQAGENKS